MKNVLAMAALVTFTSIASANTPPSAPTAAAAPSKADLLARAQTKVNTVCVACHGIDGMSPIPVNPNIAGMPPQYIAKQLQHFKSGERKNPVMLGMAAMLEPEDMVALGEYYFNQRPKDNAAARDKALAERGQKIYRVGVPESKVPACAGCHGGAGAGMPAIYPRLAGQWPDYTLAQLRSYASKERAHPVMGVIAARMREDDMKAVVEYIAGMRSK